MPRGTPTPWRLSVLATGDIRGAAQEVLEFNQRNAPGAKSVGAIIDALELKAATPDEIESQQAVLPRHLVSYFEIPSGGEVFRLTESLARAGARAKIRTGGVTPDAFPAAADVLAFIVACRQSKVPFKATAGLHHAVRGDYRLTYDDQSPRGTMYGFLNIFLAALLIDGGASESTALAALEDRDPSAFVVTDKAVLWRDNGFALSQIQSARTDFAISFGSCSFREPLDELEAIVRAGNGASDQRDLSLR
jgi:hypothetical protein